MILEDDLHVNEIDRNTARNTEHENPTITNPPTDIIAEEKNQKTAKTTGRLKFHQFLNSKNGLFSLYKNTSATTQNYKNKEPLKFIQKIIYDVKKWNLEVNQRYEHQYFLDTMRRQGKDNKTVHFMEKLRQVHKSEITEQEFLEENVIEMPELVNMNEAKKNQVKGNNRETGVSQNKKEWTKNPQLENTSFKQKTALENQKLLNAKASLFKKKVDMTDF